jgi:hypothetical protein
MTRLVLRQKTLAQDTKRTELSGFGPERIVAPGQGPSWFVVGSLLVAAALVALGWLPTLIA